MLAAEHPLEKGAREATPRRKSMECRTKSDTSAKKLVQARLPFKRLSTTPKQDRELIEAKKPKHASSPKHISVDLNTSASDVENEQSHPFHLEHPSSAKLVNGKGPLDNFMHRGNKVRTTEKTNSTSSKDASVMIDLTEDSNPAASCVEMISSTNEQNENKSAGLSNGIAEQSGNCSHLDMNSPSDSLSTNCDCKIETDNLTDVGLSLSSSPEKKNDFESANKLNANNCCQEVDSVVLGNKVAKVVLEKLQTSSINTTMNEDESGPETTVLLSPSSTSSLSTTESSPEECRTASMDSTPTHKTPENNKNTSEKSKRRSLKDMEREEKRRKQQAEKEERDRIREETKAAKERAKEEARKKKEEEKEAKEKERREKKEKEEKEKAEKLRVKEEKRREKQDALEAKLEEKRKKEEEKRLKEEKERVKAEKAGITRFFNKNKTPQAPKNLVGACGKFAPFEIRENMALAPLSRVICEPNVLEELDLCLQDQCQSMTWIQELQTRKPRRSRPTWPRVSRLLPVNDCVVVVEGTKPEGVPDRKECGLMKLLQFHENYRPAYWGTWSKKSKVITPRRPLNQDKDHLEYEVDSDEEWEEEEPGESLSHSEGDDDDDGGDDDDDDDGFFVPHGYLSEGEGASEEECMDPENQKVRQKLKAKEWDELMSKGKKFKVLQPVVIGCMWDSESTEETKLRMLRQYELCTVEPLTAEDSPSSESKLKDRKEDHILSQLLPLLHGNVNGSKAIIQEFQECCRRNSLPSSTPPEGSNSPQSPESPLAVGEESVPSKYRLKRLISENAVYEKRSTLRRSCWYVHDEVLKRFSQESLPVPCQWNYVTQVPFSNREDGTVFQTGTGNMPNTPLSAASTKRKPVGSMSITKFMKKSSDPEQSDAMETDGFQADTEEDEEDGDCMIVCENINTGPAQKCPV
ncbi:chromatin assembly factor 1 subunit A isoform X1 [Erpetoichthys calabaricus]|uniref:chromatin assembly factor 1 subunit A isoform X1 n=2 Tax=Erpetoichthys calabaricus TaxID=27687 RepID=UPI0022348AEB|nr:chromatin assembly factor 1 subunit A isoform X1 [Erpetoichthys calabaricus]